MRTTKAQISLRIHQLVIAFVVRCLESIISLDAFFIISIHWLASFYSPARQFESGLVANLRKQVFSWRGSHILLEPCQTIMGHWTLLSLQSGQIHLSCRMTKPTKWHVCPAKTQISLGNYPVWSESLLCAQWVPKNPRCLHADSEDSDQTWQTYIILLILSCCGSFVIFGVFGLFILFFHHYLA